MLVLTCARGDSVEIITSDGQRITVVVQRSRASAVRLGINAPADVAIFRTKIYEGPSGECDVCHVRLSKRYTAKKDTNYCKDCLE